MYRSARWLPLIAQAQSEAQLVTIMRDYLATWLPSDLERLPPECRFSAVYTAGDIATVAVTLAQHELKGGLDEQSAELLRQMADVFVGAQSRLRQILGRAHDPTFKE